MKRFLPISLAFCAIMVMKMDALMAQCTSMSINSNPTSTAIGAVVTCQMPINVELTADPTPPMGTYTYQWAKSLDGTNFTNVGTNSITFTAIGIGKYRVVATPTMGSSCTGFIDIIGAPMMVDPADVTVCSGSGVNIDFMSNIPTFWTSGEDLYQNAVVYKWSVLSNPTGISGLPSVGQVNTGDIATGALTGAGTVNLTVHPELESSDGGVCQGTPFTFTITVGGGPTLVLGPNPKVCQGAVSTMLPFSNLTGSPNHYAIDFDPTANSVGFSDIPNGNLPGGSSGNLTISVPSNAPTGTYFATISVSTAANCNSILYNFAVTVNPKPTAVVFGGDSEVCSGNDTIFTASGGNTYSWSNGPNTAINTVSTAGSYTVTVFDGNGCTDTETVSLEVTQTPGAINNSDNSVCVGQTTTAIAFTPVVSGVTYHWLTSGNNIGALIGANGTGDFPAFTVNNAGTMMLTVYGTRNGANGLVCSGPTKTISLTAGAAPFVSTIAATPASICVGTAVSIALNGSPGASFDWTNNNTGIGLAGSGTGAFNAAGAATVNFTATNAGSATFKATPKFGSCTGVEKTFSLVVNPSPSNVISVQEISGTDNDEIICSQDQFTLTTSGNSCTWVPPAGSGLTPPNSSSVWANISLNATGIFTAVISNASGCTATGSKLITVRPDPQIDFSVSSPCTGQTLSLSLLGTQNYSGYAWTKDGIVLPNGSQKTYTKSNAQDADKGNYQLSVIDNAGCQWSVSHIVDIDPKPVPTLSQEFLSVCRNGQGYYRVLSPTSASQSNFQWTISPNVNAADTANYGSLIFVHWKTPGTYTITVKEVLGTDFNSPCAGTAQVTVVVTNTGNALNPPEIGYFQVNNILICKDSTLCYQWGYFEPVQATMTDLPGETYQAYGGGESYDADRIYYCKTWAGNCATPTCPTVSFRISPIDSEGAFTQPVIKLFPNPNTGVFQFEARHIPDGQYTLFVTDAWGRQGSDLQIIASDGNGINVPIALDRPTSGMHCVTLMLNGKRVSTKTFIVHPD